MANRNTKHRNNLARKARAQNRWARKLAADAEKHKHTVRKS